MSADPALGEYIPSAPINDEARKANRNLPGQGGVFNTVNFHLYHYAGNNPVKYTDPDGKSLTATLVATAPIWGPTFAKGLGAGIALVLGAIASWNLAKAIDNAQQQAESKPSPLPQEGASSGDTKPEDVILEDARQGRETKGHTTQWEKKGGKDQANSDFDKLKPKDVTNNDGIRTGTLEDGRKMNVRDQSSDGRPTLEIQDGKNRIKIRYNE